MPFRPKLIHPEMPPTDEYGDLQLPADLALLAEQLQLDAEYLAGTYPPDPMYDVHCSGNVGPVARKRRGAKRRRTLLIGTLASLLIAAIGAPIAVQQFKHREHEARVAANFESHSADEVVPKLATPPRTDSGRALIAEHIATTVSPQVASPLPPTNPAVTGTMPRDNLLILPGKEPAVSKVGHLRDAELDLLELEVTTPIFIEL